MIDYEIRGKICILRLNRPPLNTIDLKVLDALVESIERACAEGAVEAIVLTGGVEHFSAGADIHLFETIDSPEEAKDLSRRFQEAFARVEACSKPVVAALAGKVMGGALELAMACHFRLATAETQFSLPEVRLGILPGAGGTQRLTRLVGPAEALRMILSGNSIGAAQALRAGLVDAIAPGEGLVEHAAGMLAGRPPMRRTCDRTDRLDEAELAASLGEAEKAIAASPAELAAPRWIARCVAAAVGQPFSEGILAEREAFAACSQSAAARNRIGLFFATRRVARLPELDECPERRIDRVAVVGMGSMGTGIAQAMATAGLSVIVFDQQHAAVEKALGRIGQSLRRRAGQGKITPERAEADLARIVPAERFEAIADAELVVESVFEILEVKQDVLRRIESVCAPEAIVATNTSTLSLDALAEALRRDDRLVGMHFFNPAHAMPLVEIIRRVATARQVVAAAVQLARRLKKTPVLVNNREGFLVNRVFVPYLVESFHLLEEGADPRLIDAAMAGFGFPMGPITLCDMTGIDIVVHAHRQLHDAFPYHGPLAEVAHRLVELGRNGQKSGAGVYRYEPGGREALDDPSLDDILASVRARPGHPATAARTFSGEEIQSRLVGRMTAEAFRVLEEDVARGEADLDVAMVLGTGFPDYRGGIVRYARDRGLDTVVAELENLTEHCSERFAPSDTLRALAKTTG